MFLQLIPTLVIVGCEIVALVMITGRAQGTARTLGVVAVVILLLCSVERSIFVMAMPTLYQRFGSGLASALSTFQSTAVAGLALLGLALLGLAAILASRQAVADGGAA